jgi:predicted nuclease with TOPRIM domain
MPHKPKQNYLANLESKIQQTQDKIQDLEHEVQTLEKERERTLPKIYGLSGAYADGCAYGIAYNDGMTVELLDRCYTCERNASYALNDLRVQKEMEGITMYVVKLLLGPIVDVSPATEAN